MAAEEEGEPVAESVDVRLLLDAARVPASPSPYTGPGRPQTLSSRRTVARSRLCNWKASAAAADDDTAAAATAVAAVSLTPMLPLPWLESAASDDDSASRSPGGETPRSCKDYIPVGEVPAAPILIPGEREKFRPPAGVRPLGRG
jgi:hypothetical protein